jgi:transcriptional regulator with XRE-family HTH domain
MKRTINSDLLRKLVRSQGEYAVAKTAMAAKIGVSTLEKLMLGSYPNVPKDSLRERLCEALNVKEDLLFPKAATDGKKKAS